MIGGRHAACPDADGRCVHGPEDQCPVMQALAHFDSCPGTKTCMQSTTRCLKGGCMRTRPHAFSYVKANPNVCAICLQLATHSLHAGKLVIEIPEL